MSKSNKARNSNSASKRPPGRAPLERSPLADARVEGPILAAFCGVTEQTVRKWAVEGLVERGPDRKFPLADSVRRVLEALRAQASRQPTSAKLVDARTRRIEADAEMREMKLATARNEMVPIRDVDGIVHVLFKLWHGLLKALPTRLSHELRWDATATALCRSEVDRSWRELLKDKVPRIIQTVFSPEQFKEFTASDEYKSLTKGAAK